MTGDLHARLRSLRGGDEAIRLARASADPDMALRNLDRYAGARGRLPSDIAAAVVLFAGSQSLSAAAIRTPDLLEQILADRALPDTDTLRDRLRARLDEPVMDPRAPLRHFVREETLRLLLADLTGDAPVEVVAAQLSRIAIAAINGATDVAFRELAARHGIPRFGDGGAARLTVIGLGKLGGHELNYSSDIDLLFLYEDEGQTDAEDGHARRRNADFFRRVVDRARHLLDDRTDDGHCYRVDLRLRPDGAAGALTRTVTSALDYYLTRGRTWERQAFIKASVVAGDRDLGEREFLRPMAAFVYGAPIRIGEIRQVKELKRQIERREPDRRQIKAGPGGIRDIEFTVQFLQLLNGHRMESVRTPGTLPALMRLADTEALTREEAAALSDAYRFLRTVEHRLQTMHEVRTHLLPADPGAVGRLARRMGLGGEGVDPVAAFRAEHARHAGAARRVLTRLFTDLFLAESAELHRLSDFVLTPDEASAPARDWLADRGFTDPDAAIAVLGRIARTPHPRARQFFASVAPALLLRAVATPEPDRCLHNFERIANAIGARATFFQMLSESEDLLGVLTDLCGWSQHLADLLAINPAMFDGFADSLVVMTTDGQQPWDDLPLDEIETVEDPGDVLHDLRDRALLRIGVRDIQGRANTENTAADLTATAERVLALAIRRVRRELEERYGPLPPDARFAVIGLGKFGAREMSYASDLDLVFVADATGTTGGRPVSERMSRLFQGTLRLLATPGPRGRLYEVDPRVRPYGRSGAITISPERLREYYQTKAGVAELQMLTKARVVAGDADLAAQLEGILDDVLYGGPPRDGLAAAVRKMRRRLEEGARGRDVKRGFGGMVDIEFVVEYLKLRHGRDHPSLRVPGTVAALSAARRADLLEDRDHERLLTALQFLRSVESRMRIVYDMAADRIPESTIDRDRLARRLGYVGDGAGDALLEEYAYHTSVTRELFLRLVIDT